jgi:hypothetical protein
MSNAQTAIQLNPVKKIPIQARCIKTKGEEISNSLFSSSSSVCLRIFFIQLTGDYIYTKNPKTKVK